VQRNHRNHCQQSAVMPVLCGAALEQPALSREPTPAQIGKLIEFHKEVHTADKKLGEEVEDQARVAQVLWPDTLRQLPYSSRKRNRSASPENNRSPALEQLLDCHAAARLTPTDKTAVPSEDCSPEATLLDVPMVSQRSLHNQIRSSRKCNLPSISRAIEASKRLQQEMYASDASDESSEAGAEVGRIINDLTDPAVGLDRRNGPHLRAGLALWLLSMQPELERDCP
jgi:hypothetical protein